MRVKDDVDHQRHAAPEPVPEQSEDERAYGTHCQRKRDRVAQLGDARAKVACHRHDHERKKEKIEGIECPAEEAS